MVTSSVFKNGGVATDGDQTPQGAGHIVPEGNGDTEAHGFSL